MLLAAVLTAPVSAGSAKRARAVGFGGSRYVRFVTALLLSQSLWVVSVAATPVDVSVVAVASAEASKDLRVEVTATAMIRQGAVAAPVRGPLQADAGREARFDLPPGLWSVEAKAEGYWSAPEAVFVEGHSQQPLAVGVTLWPAAAVVGHLSGPPAKASFDELSLTFESACSDSAKPCRDAVRRATVICEHALSALSAQTTAEFSCVVPATVLDLELNLPGYATHYTWAVGAPPGETVDLGQISLKAGASVVGWVTDGAGGERRGRKCRAARP